MGGELRRRDLVDAKIFYDSRETADDLVERLKQCHPGKVIWYRPQKLFRQVVPRLHDLGLSVVGVDDGGFPGVRCQYAINRELALIQIISE
jgi:hypothetical protein